MITRNALHYNIALELGQRIYSSSFDPLFRQLTTPIFMLQEFTNSPKLKLVYKLDHTGHPRWRGCCKNRCRLAHAFAKIWIQNEWILFLNILSRYILKIKGYYFFEKEFFFDRFQRFFPKLSILIHFMRKIRKKCIQKFNFIIHVYSICANYLNRITKTSCNQQFHQSAR